MRYVGLGLWCALSLLLQNAAWAQRNYTIQSILKQGDRVGEPPITVDSYLAADQLNDAGHLVINTLPLLNQSILQYADGKFSLIVVGGRPAPGGVWPTQPATWEPFSMDRAGNLVYSAEVVINSEESIGTFYWDFKAQRSSAVLLEGMPTGHGQVFDDGGGWSPSLNNVGEMALVGILLDATGTRRFSLFFRKPNGELLPIAFPGQAAPGGGTFLRAWLPSINDAGVVAFIARRDGETEGSAYLWQAGQITRPAAVDSDLPGGAKIAAVRGVWTNNRNRNVLLSVGVSKDGAVSDALHLATPGGLVPVVVAGQLMPGGGRFKALQQGLGTTWPIGVSTANDAGQHAFLAQLEDGGTGAYLMDADGTLSLILKSGTVTSLGLVTRVGANIPVDSAAANAIALNTRGQIALSVHVGGVAGSEVLVLLTP